MLVGSQLCIVEAKPAFRSPQLATFLLNNNREIVVIALKHTLDRTGEVFIHFTVSDGLRGRSPISQTWAHNLNNCVRFGRPQRHFSASNEQPEPFGRFIFNRLSTPIRTIATKQLAFASVAPRHRTHPANFDSSTGFWFFGRYVPNAEFGGRDLRLSVDPRSGFSI